MTAVVGFVFWILATRLVPPGPIGLASASMASIGVLQSLADLGLAVSLLHYASTEKFNTGDLTNTVMGAIYVTSSSAAVIFLFGIPLWSPGLMAVRYPVWLALTFALAAVANAVLGVQDAVMLATRHPRFLFWRHTTISFLKLLLLLPLLMLVDDDFHAVFLASVLPLILTAAIANMAVLPRYLPRFHFFAGLNRQILAGLLQYGLSNYASNLLWGLPALLLPIICVNLVSPEGTAYFTISWTLLNLVLLAPRAVAPTLMAEVSRDRHGLLTKGWRAMSLMIRLSALPVLALWFFGSYLAGWVFGDQYSNVLLLHILLISAIPYIFNSTYVSLLRGSESLRELLLVTGLCGVGTVMFSIALAPTFGEIGIAMGWLLGQLLAVLVAIPRIWRVAQTALIPNVRTYLSGSKQ